MTHSPLAGGAPMKPAPAQAARNGTASKHADRTLPWSMQTLGDGGKRTLSIGTLLNAALMSEDAMGVEHMHPAGTRGITVWTNLPSTATVWLELGKGWANGLIKGNILERLWREGVFNLLAPGLGTAVTFLVEHYRGKLSKHIGPNGIWIAVRPMMPGSKAPPLGYAKQRNEDNKQKAPDPWEPTGSNIF